MEKCKILLDKLITSEFYNRRKIQKLAEKKVPKKIFKLRSFLLKITFSCIKFVFLECIRTLCRFSFCGRVSFWHEPHLARGDFACLASLSSRSFFQALLVNQGEKRVCIQLGAICAVVTVAVFFCGEPNQI